MDDSAILVKTKKEAKQALKLNNKTQIFKNKQGVNYCGYIQIVDVNNLKNKLFYIE